MRTLLLILLLPTAHLFSQDENLSPHQEFKKKHIINKMAASGCAAVIRKRNISTFDQVQRKKTCKTINTFILAEPQLVDSVCLQGKTRGQFKESGGRFPLVVCRLNDGGNQYPKCSYRGQRVTGKILIGCENNEPVHFERYIEDGEV